MNVKQVQSRSRFLRRAIFRKEFVYNDRSIQPSITRIATSEIDNLEDPDLRYALRFHEAARTVGHFVTIEATSEGVSSTLVEATYSGVTGKTQDTFMQDLRRQAPLPEVPGMTVGLVYGQDGDPDTHFWVPSR